ncbi:uncharacterized protein [Garra rufa]|uniref:uncharacterized protein n=1 Tax=Garra rufa TaxID=137080 RepID=UPI003CCEF2BF
MDPTVRLILLRQEERSLEDHTREFISLAEHFHFPASSLCIYYHLGLNSTTKALLSGEGPQESLPDFIEWVLASCQSSWTVGVVEEDVSPTHDPEPSQPSPRQAELQPEPTADGVPEPRATEPDPSDQVREPASTSVTVDCHVEQERAIESPAHCTTAEGELGSNSGDLIDFFSDLALDNSCDLIDFFSEPLTCIDFPPTRPRLSESAWSPLVPPSRPEFPLVPPSRPEFPLVPPSSPEFPLVPPSSPEFPLVPPSRPKSPRSAVSPPAHPQPTTCAVGSPRDCQLPSASRLEDSSAPPPASESWTPPRPFDPAVPPRLSTPSSSPSPINPPAPPGSIVFPAPPWSVVTPSAPQDSAPPAVPRRAVPTAPWDSSFLRAQPPSSVAPPRISGTPPRAPEPAPPWPFGSSASPRIIGSPSSPRAPYPSAPPLSVGPMESARLRPPWFLPPSAPQWAVIMAVVWVCSSCPGSLLSPPWLLPPSSPPWTVCSATWTFVLVPLLASRPPPTPPPVTLLFCFLAPLVHFCLFFLRREDAPFRRGA